MRRTPGGTEADRPRTSRTMMRGPTRSIGDAPRQLGFARSDRFFALLEFRLPPSQFLGPFLELRRGRFFDARQFLLLLLELFLLAHERRPLVAHFSQQLAANRFAEQC